METEIMTQREALGATIKEILDNFDFEKVHAVMTLVDWKWHDSHVPSVEELRDKARYLLVTVCAAEESETMCATGGLFAHKCDLEIGLAFELESCNVTPESMAWKEVMQLPGIQNGLAQLEPMN